MAPGKTKCTAMIAVAALAALHRGAVGTTAPQGDRGQETFAARCAACHTVGGGRLVGPDLQGVGERRAEAWIIAFIQHPQQVVAAGDSAAVALFREYQQIPMPDQPLSADEIRELLRYIQEAASPGAEAAPVAVTATDEQILLGAALFQGRTRLTNRGPPCISCHDVTHEGITGGALARELTTAVTRLGQPGVQSVIANPPFPVMQRAYQQKALTEAEVTALVGFLGRVGAQQAFHQPRGLGRTLFIAAAAGSVLLLGLYALVWRRRLRGSVNQGIYHRQIPST